MPKGILYVETRPASDEQAAAYHQWYEGTHMREMLSLDGVVAARRFAPVDGENVYVAVYEIEADDITSVQAQLAAASRSGTFSTPVGVQTDPPPAVRLYREIRTHTA
ncbi:hypothetical protein J2W56_000747 [Nocardia kruczakiae]|uniref:DUF4286 family protein n=1 Tax=Nocardia kruczakiae TaxID=261477 RepID=A0ABU1X9R4_9NOCA|nr:hypothetical protein [Nocardia kruczakiae]MDR7167029.1 hypothetical protein [Nocardia kruczakiae]